MVFLTAFLLGLAGSLHCAGMCGPLLVALAKARPGAHGRFAGRVFYHLGRMLSYCLLGLLLGLASHFAAPAGFQRWLSVALGIALLGGLLLSRKLPISTPIWKWISVLKGAMQLRLPRRTLFSQAVMGALNGLLPCGLVYAAAVGAASTGDALSGAAYMALFGLGTCPMMLGIHFAGQRLPLPSRLSVGVVTRAAVFLMAILLVLRGLELGIPFVSPEIGPSQTNARCH